MVPRSFVSSSNKTSTTSSTTTRKPYAEKAVKIKVLSKLENFSNYILFF